MITLNAADEPERGFIADYSLVEPSGGCELVWPIPGAAPHSPLLDQAAMPWLSEMREPTVPLTRTVTTSTASGGYQPLIYRIDFPGEQATP